jgi:hypothetical protein
VIAENVARADCQFSSLAALLRAPKVLKYRMG